MKNLPFSFALLLAFFASSFTLPSTDQATFLKDKMPAAFDAFLKLEGIKGESKDKDHKDWIVIESVQLNTSANTIDLTRRVSPTSSPALKRLAAGGTRIKKAILHVRKAGGDGYLEYELENVLVSSYQVSGSSSRPMESLSLNYTKITY